jgi:deubiquitinase DESI2
MGKTIFTQDEIENIIYLLGRDFKGKDYNVLDKNCNHFTDRLCKILTGIKRKAWS